MSTVLCTLFEGDYHLGAAALVNSLLAAGFSGEVAAGFRGPPPPWMQGALRREWPSAAGTLAVRLVPLDTPRHLTNFKPDFLLERLREGASTLWYLDPDIVVTARWSFFDEWAAAGVALCEDVTSPLPASHPRRAGWRRHFGGRGFSLHFREPAYVNGGCVGLRAEHAAFLEIWRDLQLAMADAIGGLDQSKLGGGTSDQMRDPLFCFNASDQDALNAAIEAAPATLPFSILGAEAMGFRPGATVLPHALGTPKPWRKRFLREALQGRPPTLADKAFWQFATGPVALLPAALVNRRRRALRLASFLGRFYRRS